MVWKGGEKGLRKSISLINANILIDDWDLFAFMYSSGILHVYIFKVLNSILNYFTI